MLPDMICTVLCHLSHVWEDEVFGANCVAQGGERHVSIILSERWQIYQVDQFKRWKWRLYVKVRMVG